MLSTTLFFYYTKMFTILYIMRVYKLPSIQKFTSANIKINHIPNKRVMPCGSVGSKEWVWRCVSNVGCVRMPCNVSFVTGAAISQHPASQQAARQLQARRGYGVEPDWYVPLRVHCRRRALMADKCVSVCDWKQLHTTFNIHIAQYWV